MSWPTFWRAGLLQAASVAVVAVALALALPHSFFEDWGWLAGPAAWAACALLVARVLRLPAPGVLVGAALAGVPAALAVLTGEHWLGTALGLPVFALWCARLRRDGDVPAKAV
ncbi:MAG TPA: hypothetical protein VLA98_03760 [Solirubrobacteraceae bacterium]|nr:hypothetical protein [Solirubrobacteraceae bacterium]